MPNIREMRRYKKRQKRNADHRRNQIGKGCHQVQIRDLPFFIFRICKVFG